MKIKNRANILLVGDWTLDEHWVTGSHSISTSSRTGGTHRFIHNDINEEIINVSGAGRVASSLLKCADLEVNLFALGVWEENGNERISSFFTDYGVERKKRNEFRINWDFPPISSHNHEEYPGLISLYNLNVIPDKVGTNRVIRIYDKIGSKVKLIERIDFIDNSSLSEKNDDINNLTIKILKEIKEKTTNDKTPIEHIIIKDLDHGVVTKDLIEKLIYEFPPDKINFYISSKRWLPDWLECFNDKNVKLLIIPQMSSQIALRDKKFDTWMTKLGFITYDGLNLMELKDDSDCFGSIKINKLIILPEKERVIAYDSELNDRGNNLYIQTESQDNYSEIELPMASMFFPEVIKILISEPKIEFGQVVGRALIETVKWRKSLFEYINENKPRFVLKTKNSNLDDQSKKFRNKINFGKWKEVNFAKAQKNWELSLSNLGLRDLGEAYSLEFSNCNNRIELWRAKTIIDGYVCISANRKAKIRKLFYSLLRNESTKLKRSEVSFIKASPGSGKSHLVNSLANALGLTLVSFNLSQIQSIDQLIDCFDEINTSQAENKDQKPIIVFFDEINTKIEGVYPY